MSVWGVWRDPKTLWEEMVFVARYGHQPLSEIGRLTLRELDLIAEIISNQNKQMAPPIPGMEE